MRLGIDLGTTRTIVAASDRGNFPVVGFVGPEGDVVDHQPTVSAEWRGELVHGHEAERAAAAGAPTLRSWKRLLGRFGPEHRVRIGAIEIALVDLAADFLRFVAEQILTTSNLPGPPRSPGEIPETVVSVPAHASASQRFTTFEAYRRAGFPVLAMLNEPSAAGVEYAHRYGRTLTRARDHVAIYDLGGGTFDTALVRLGDGEHDVVDSAGIPELGGDDFDEILLELGLEVAGIPADVAAPHREALRLECRAAKEAITPATRRLLLDFAALGDEAPGAPIIVPVEKLERRVAPLVERTLEVLGRILRADRDDPLPRDVGEVLAQARLAGLYVVGGASALPMVARPLRDVFGRRVHRSAYPSGATAIGLAIAAEEGGGAVVRERLGHHLGVFREAESGSEVVFDPLFSRGDPTPLPGEPALVATRRYRAAHNVGHFRFVECDALDEAAHPRGDLAPQAALRFPLTPELRGVPLDQVPVQRLPQEGRWIEERYEVEPGGMVAVTIRDLEDGYVERFQI